MNTNEINLQANLTTENNLQGKVEVEITSTTGTLEGEQLKGILTNTGSIEGSNLGVEVFVQGVKLDIEKEYKGYLNSFVGEQGLQGEKGENGKSTLEIYREMTGNSSATEQDLMNFIVNSLGSYNRSTPTSHSLGGVPAGTVFNDRSYSISDILDMLFFAPTSTEEIRYPIYYSTATKEDIENKSFTSSDFKVLFTDRREVTLRFDMNDGEYALMIYPSELFKIDAPILSVNGFVGGFEPVNIIFNGESTIAYKTCQHGLGKQTVKCE